MTMQTFQVPEVHCGHCVSSIETAVGALDGVDSVKVDLDTKNVTVSFDEASIPPATIVAAIEGQGYDVAAS